MSLICGGECPRKISPCRENYAVNETIFPQFGHITRTLTTGVISLLKFEMFVELPSDNPSRIHDNAA